MGWLERHQTSIQEIADLLALTDRDLAASRTTGLDADWRLNIACNAALQAATAALAACGYRAERESHHFRVLQSLTLTINADASMVQQLDRFRRKRNLGAYERAGWSPIRKRRRCGPSLRDCETWSWLGSRKSTLS